MSKSQISNWSNYPKVKTDFQNWTNTEFSNADTKSIVRGLGRCYGDASLGEHTISSLDHNLFLDFNQKEGVLTCESGVSLEEVLEVIVPKGWFLPVTPGTKYITVGGALASDIHGKNHHVDGCFGDHVLSFSIYLPDGKLKICTLENDPELFNATRGGMGLTGMIETITFKLKKIPSAYIAQRQFKAKNLKEAFDLFQEHKTSTYSMAWIDCLKGGSNFGRSIVMTGEFAEVEQLPRRLQNDPLNTGSKKKLSIPFNFPGFVLNTLSIKAFNWLYYNKNTKPIQENIVHYDGFFYPLDAILHWNRMYGKEGFLQYQFVLPLENSFEGLEKILKEIRKKGWGSFLAVLKLFGKQDSFISFPMEGYTLALDFPIKKGIFEFLNEMDKIVLDLGGRLYLTKDARMTAETFKTSYPNSQAFIDYIKSINPEGKIESFLSKRLEIT